MNSSIHNVEERQMKAIKLIALIVIVLFAVNVINAQTKTSKTKAKAKTVTEEVSPVQQAAPLPLAKDGVFIQLSSGSENPQSVLMALTLALKMADDHDVYFFADLKGPEIFLTKTHAVEMRHFEASKVLIQKLLDKGVTFGVCQTCLELMNQTEFDLMKGIKLANKADFFRFTSGRILTLSF